MGLVATLVALAGLAATSTSSGHTTHLRARATTPVSVLGEELTKQPPPEVAPPAPVAQPVDPAPAPPALSAAPAPVSSAAPVTPAPRVATAPVVAAPVPAGPAIVATAPDSGAVSLSKQPVVVHAFNHATFSFSPDPSQNTASSSSATDRSTATPVALEVVGQADNSTAAVSIKVTNATGHDISFPGGLSVDITLTRDGSVVASTTASDPGVVRLPPSGSAVIDSRVPLSSYGSYALDGTLSYLSA